ncbi:MAG: hypothetical protein AAGD92_01495 [Pseudomonadota bacterium]
MANAWVIDARAYNVSGDLSNSTLMQSEQIRDFLATPQSTSAIVIAPKGCGKTLLIKHKRKMLEKQDYLLIPQNQMVDTNAGTASDFSNEDLDAIESMPDFWSQLWQIAICVAVLQALKQHEALEPLKAIDEKITNDKWSGPFEIFEHLLKTRISDFHELYEIFRIHIRPAYRSDHSQRVAVFVDNIDEYFWPHLEKTDRMIEPAVVRDRVYGQLSRPFWDSAQVGFLLAARALRALNPHIKIYGAIRSEALNSYRSALPDAANARALLIEPHYKKDDLRKIFEINIQAERRTSKFGSSESADKFVQLVGPDNIRIRHVITGMPEHIFDYCWRHTLGRPRDLMRIGGKIATLDLAQRTRANIRRAVDDEAAEICADYLGEVRRQFVWFDEDVLFPLIHACVLPRSEVETVAMQYQQTCAQGVEMDEPLAVFADLYNAGLLGMTSMSPDGVVQRFMGVDEIGSAIHIERRSLPEASRYLLHPILGSYLRKHFPNGINSAHSVNIVAPDAPWRDESDMHFMLKADVVQSSAICQDDISAKAFKQFFTRMVRETMERDVDYCEIDGGDGVLLIDQSLYLLLKKAELLHGQLQARYDTTARFGLEWGPVEFTTNANGAREVHAGDLMIRAERLRAATAPGEIMLLDHALREFAQFDFPFTIRPAQNVEKAGARPRKAGGWILGKGHDGINVAALYALPVARIAEINGD